MESHSEGELAKGAAGSGQRFSRRPSTEWITDMSQDTEREEEEKKAHAKNAARNFQFFSQATNTTNTAQLAIYVHGIAWD